MASINWVSYKEPKWLQEHYSTKELKLVFMNGNTPLTVAKIGLVAIPMKWSRDYDRLAFVKMTPQNVEATFVGNFHTQDKIALRGKINAQVKIKEDNESIKRIVVNSQQEEISLTDQIRDVLRKNIALFNYLDIVPLSQDFDEKVLKAINNFLVNTKSCFEVISIAIDEMRPENQQMVAFIEQRAKDKQQKETEKAELIQSLEIKDVQNKYEAEKKQRDSELTMILAKAEAAHKLEIQNKEAEQKRKNDEANFALKMMQEDMLNRLTEEKALTDLNIRKGIADIVKDEAGKIAVYPDQMFKLLDKIEEWKIAQLGEKEKVYRECVKLLGSFQAGQNSAMKAIVERMFNVQLSDHDISDKDLKKPIGADGDNDNKEENKDEIVVENPEIIEEDNGNLKEDRDINTKK